MKKIVTLFIVLFLMSCVSTPMAQAAKISDLPALEAQHFKFVQQGKSRAAEELMLKQIQPLREAAKAASEKPERFVDNGDGTITDSGLSIMWTKNANHGLHSVKGGKAYCKKLVFAGHDDWRMPSSDELETLLGATSQGKLLKSLFENIQGPTYWSVTNDDMAWGKTRGLSFWTMDRRVGDGDETAWILPVRSTKKAAKKGLLSW